MLQSEFLLESSRGECPLRMLITHPPVDDRVVESVRIGLRQYGYEDGNNIKLEVRGALGQADRVPICRTSRFRPSGSS